MLTDIKKLKSHNGTNLPYENRSLRCQNLYQSNIAKDNNKIKFKDYPQRLAPAGVQDTLVTLKVVVKEVEVEMEVVVIQ